MKTLFLEERGGYFNNPDSEVIKNFRYFGYINSIEYGLMFIKVSHCGWKYRYVNKRTGARLKHPINEPVNNAVIHFEYESIDGGTYGVSKYCKSDMKYNEEEILKYINSISSIKYDNIKTVKSFEKSNICLTANDLAIIQSIDRNYNDKAAEIVKEYNEDICTYEQRDYHKLCWGLASLARYIANSEFFNLLDFHNLDYNVDVLEYHHKTSEAINEFVKQFINNSDNNILTAEDKE